MSATTARYERIKDRIAELEKRLRQGRDLGADAVWLRRQRERIEQLEKTAERMRGAVEREQEDEPEPETEPKKPEGYPARTPAEQEQANGGDTTHTPDSPADEPDSEWEPGAAEWGMPELPEWDLPEFGDMGAVLVGLVVLLVVAVIS